MDWSIAMVMASGILFTVGLVLFFVEAWIFAMQTQITWLIILLTITSAVALFAQSYLWAIAASIFPEPKPLGVTPINRQVFALFPFDTSTCLVRRQRSNGRPSIGWEVQPPRQLLRSYDPTIETSETRQSEAPRLLHMYTKAWSTHGLFANVKDGEEIEDTEVTGQSEQQEHELTNAQEADEDQGANISATRRSFLLPLSPPSRSDKNAVNSPGASDDVVKDVVSPRRCTSPITNCEVCSEQIRDGTGNESCSEDSNLRVATASIGMKLAEDALEPSCVARFSLDGTTTPQLCNSKFGRNFSEGTFSGALIKAVKISMQQESQETDSVSSPTVFDLKSETEAGEAASDEGTENPFGGEDTPLETRPRSYSLTAVSEKDGRKSNADFDMVESELNTSVAGDSIGTESVADAPNTIIRGQALVRVNQLSEICAICLGQYVTGEDVLVLPCLHMFHAECLDVWIGCHPSCPYCKGNLNILPTECGRTTAALCIARRVLVCLASLATWPIARFRGRRRRRLDLAGESADRTSATRQPSPMTLAV